MSNSNKLVLATLYSCYSTAGVCFIYFCHGSWFVLAKKLSCAPETAHIELTVLKTMFLGFPFLISILFVVFALVIISEFLEQNIQTSKHRRFVPLVNFFPSLIFFVILTLGIYGNWYIPLAFNAVMNISMFLYSGIIGLSYLCHTYFRRMRNKLDLVKKQLSDKYIFSKRLELEHTFFQENLHLLIWGTIILTTGGILALYINPLRPMPYELISEVVKHDSLKAIWFLLGIWFGIYHPISYNMLYIRLLLEEISV